MDSSFKSDFLSDFTRDGCGPVLALFGKHPAWDDHMDDFGVVTSSLRMCKRFLYIQGMAANAARLQSASEGTERGILPYGHFLLWARDQEMILLRVIESEDGRGRNYFPLVGAVHFSALKADEALSRIIAPLRTFVDACRAFRNRDEVSELHRETQTALQSELGRIDNMMIREAPTSGELDAMRGAIVGTSFVRLKVPITRNKLSESFGVLIPLIRDQPLLLAHRDTDPEIIICLGQPEKGDFWFLRERGDQSPAFDRKIRGQYSDKEFGEEDPAR